MTQPVSQGSGCNNKSSPVITKPSRLTHQYVDRIAYEACGKNGRKNYHLLHIAGPKLRCAPLNALFRQNSCPTYLSSQAIQVGSTESDSQYALWAVLDETTSGITYARGGPRRPVYQRKHETGSIEFLEPFSFMKSNPASMKALLCYFLLSDE